MTGDVVRYGRVEWHGEKERVRKTKSLNELNWIQL